MLEEAALFKVWKLSGYLAGKRLAPFMELFLTILERHGELTLAESSKKKLSIISAATTDGLNVFTQLACQRITNPVVGSASRVFGLDHVLIVLEKHRLMFKEIRVPYGVWQVSAE